MLKTQLLPIIQERLAKQFTASLTEHCMKVLQALVPDTGDVVNVVLPASAFCMQSTVTAVITENAQ